MKTTDYGFLRVILCGPTIWKETIIGGILLWGLLEFCLIVWGIGWYIVDVIGLIDSTPTIYGFFRASPLLLIFALGLALASEIKTVTVWIKSDRLRFQYHGRRERHVPIADYRLTDLISAELGFTVGGWTGLIIRYDELSSPLCFVLDETEAAETLLLIRKSIANKRLAGRDGEG